MEDIILEPKFIDFKKKYEKNISQVVSFKFSNTEKTITSSFLKTSKNDKNSFLFESLEDGDTKGRFSIIGLKPDLIFKVIDNQSIIEENGSEVSREHNQVNKNIHPFPLDVTEIENCKLVANKIIEQFNQFIQDDSKLLALDVQNVGFYQ